MGVIVFRDGVKVYNTKYFGLLSSTLLGVNYLLKKYNGLKY